MTTNETTIKPKERKTGKGYTISISISSSDILIKFKFAVFFLVVYSTEFK